MFGVFFSKGSILSFCCCSTEKNHLFFGKDNCNCRNCNCHYTIMMETILRKHILCYGFFLYSTRQQLFLSILFVCSDSHQNSVDWLVSAVHKFKINAFCVNIHMFYFMQQFQWVSPLSIRVHLIEIKAVFLFQPKKKSIGTQFDRK